MKRLLIFSAFFFLLTEGESIRAQWNETGMSVAPFGSSFKNTFGGCFFTPAGLWIATGTPASPIVFFSSSDTGRTWIKHSLPNSLFGSISSIRFLDQLNGIMTVANGIGITSDGGQTWVYNFNGCYESAFMGFPNNLITVSEGILHISHDYGATYTYPSKGLGSRSLAITANGTVFAGHDPIQMSTDFGFTWESRQGRFDLQSISMDVGKLCDDSTIYIVNELNPNSYSEIYVSTDAGNSFTTRYPNQRLGYFTGSMTTSHHAVFCATSSDGVLRSTDKGKTWISIGGPGLPFDSRIIAAVNDNILFVVDSLGNVWRTDNCGGFPIKPPFPPMPQIFPASATTASCDSIRATAELMHRYCDPLTITEATLEGQDRKYYSLQPAGLPVSLGNGAKVIFNLMFNPNKEVRSFSAQIRVKGFYLYEYEDTVRIDTLIPIQGSSTPVLPNLIASPTYLGFDSISTCMPPQDTTVLLTNKGCDTLQITQGPGILSPEFSLFTPLTLPVKLAPDSSLSIKFRFKPSGTGLFTTTARFTATQQTLNQDIMINLQGEGERDVGVLNYVPQKINFPNTSVCDHDSASGLVTNIGCDSISVDPINILADPDFQVTGLGFQISEKPGDTIRYTVYLNPAKKGIRQGSIILTSNDGGNLRYDTIPIMVTITNGTRILRASINSLDFGTMTACDQKDSAIHLVNIGCDTLEVSAIGGLGSGFGTDAKFPITLLPGEDTTIDIFTILDTVGGKTTNFAFVTFAGTSDNTLTPITLSRSYIRSRHIDLGLYLDPAVKKGGDTDMVNFYIREAQDKSFTGAGIKYISFDLINHDTDLLQYNQKKSSSNVFSSNGKSFTISGSPEIEADANGIIASISYRVFLTKDSTTTIELENVVIDTMHPACTTLSFTAGGSATFDYRFSCGERTLAGFMSGNLPLSIISFRPNPAQDEAQIDVQSAVKQDASIEIRNALGVQVYSDAKSLSVGSNSLHLETKGLASGLYIVRITSACGATSQEFVKVK